MGVDYYYLYDIGLVISKIFLDFYNSTFFGVIKFLLAIYILVLFIDIILLLLVRDLGENLRMTLHGMSISPQPKDKMALQWGKIKKRLDSDSTSQYKVSILEADRTVDDILGRMGYDGANMREKLDQANPAQIDNLEDLKQAHEIRNRIVFEKDFSIDQDEARKWIDVYEEFLKIMEAL